MGAAKQKLAGYGIGEERIKSLRVESPDIARVIREEASRGDYAVVALGRRGIKHEQAADKRFMGSKSLEMLGMLERAALWVSN
jgi:hypothetical protein